MRIDQDGWLAAEGDPRVLRFLERKPLRSITIKPNVYTGANGYYGMVFQDIGIEASRKAGTYGERLQAGVSYSMSYCGPTKLEAMKRTMYHETGHHIHLAGGPEIGQIVAKAFTTSELTLKSPITTYAGHNNMEYFAECFTAHKYHGAALKAHDPVGYKMVEDVLALIR